MLLILKFFKFFYNDLVPLTPIISITTKNSLNIIILIEHNLLPKNDFKKHLKFIAKI